MNVAVKDASTDDNAVVTDTEGRREDVRVQVPSRAGGYEVRQAVGRRPIPQERNRERRGILAYHPARRVYCSGRALARTCGQRDRYDSVRIRPDERHARALVHHARADDVTAVAHAESERSVGARHRAHFESSGVPHVVNDPHISGRIVRIDALSHDPARIINAERRDKEAPVRRRLRDDRRTGAIVDHRLLKASAIDRADGHDRSVHAVRVSDRFAWGERKLRNRAVLPDHRQPVRAEECGRGSAHHDAVVVGAVRNGMVAAGQVWQAHEAAAERPGERLASAAPDRAADGDAARRHAKTLRRGVAHLDDADIENLILRLGGSGCRNSDPRDEDGNLGKRSHDRLMLDRTGTRKTFRL